MTILFHIRLHLSKVHSIVGGEYFELPRFSWVGFGFGKIHGNFLRFSFRRMVFGLGGVSLFGGEGSHDRQVGSHVSPIGSHVSPIGSHVSSIGSHELRKGSHELREGSHDVNRLRTSFERVRTSFERVRTSCQGVRTSYERVRTSYERVRTSFQRVRTGMGKWEMLILFIVLQIVININSNNLNFKSHE